MRKLSIVLVAAALVLGFSVSAMAAQALFYTEQERLPVAPTKMLEVYGSVRLNTYWVDADLQSTAFGFDDADLVWDLDDGSSRFGVRFKAGKVGANIEIRPRDRQTARTRVVSIQGQSDLLRHWYGTYDLGWGTFLVGQTWTPTFHPICNECLLGGGGFLDGYGDGGFTARAPGLQLHIPIKAMNGLMKIALLKPWTDTGPVGTAGAVAQPIVPAWGANTNWDTTLPKLEASLDGAFGPVAFNVRGGYNTVDIVYTVTDQEESVDSYVFAADVSAAFGPLYFKVLGSFTQNLGVYGIGGPAIIAGLFPTAWSGSSIEDTTGWGIFMVGGFKINDMFSVEVGWGSRTNEIDYPSGPWGSGGTIEQEASAWTIFFPISITPSFVITPELVFADNGEVKGAPAGGIGTVTNNPDRGSINYYGIYWRIDF